MPLITENISPRTKARQVNGTPEKSEHNLKNEDNANEENNLKNEDKLKNEDDLKCEEDLKNETRNAIRLAVNKI